MRDPTLTRATEAKRKEAAIDEACYRLARIALDIVSVTDDQGIRTYDPAKERRHAIAMVKCVAEKLGKDLYARNTKIRNRRRKSGKDREKAQDRPAVGLCVAALRAAIPALERTRPATMRGRSADLWRERNEAIVETRKLICQKYGFDPGRNPATRDKECGNSIISQALKKLETQLGWVEKFGVKKPDIALAESSINEICRTWKVSPPD